MVLCTDLVQHYDPQNFLQEQRELQHDQYVDALKEITKFGKDHKISHQIVMLSSNNHLQLILTQILIKQNKAKE